MPRPGFLTFLLCLALCACSGDREQMLAACKTTAAEVHPGEGDQIELRRQYTTACMVANGFELRTSPRSAQCPTNRPAYDSATCYRSSSLLSQLMQYFEDVFASR
jgi:hypothetical protein